MRSPSLPWLASSVTSNRSIGHAFRAATSRAPVPAAPVQATSARKEPCAAGCSAHDRETGAPTTRSSAHSTCWQSAFGHACTKTTPWVDRRCTAHLHRLDRSRLPLRTIEFSDALYSALTEQGSREQFARWSPNCASPDGTDESHVTEVHTCSPNRWSGAITTSLARRPVPLTSPSTTYRPVVTTTHEGALGVSPSFPTVVTDSSRRSPSPQCRRPVRPGERTRPVAC